MSYSEIYLNLSMELNWFTPDDAKKLINYSLKKKYLSKKDDLIIPNFEINKIEIPIGFVPSNQIQFNDEKKYFNDNEEILNEIINRIINKTNFSYEDMREKIKFTSNEKNIYEEIAALIIAKEYEIELEDLYENIENILF
jgi:hypothetical protein